MALALPDGKVQYGRFRASYNMLPTFSAPSPAQGRCTPETASLHLLQPSTVPLDLCLTSLTAQSIAATPFRPNLVCVSGLSLAD